jgi:phospholipid/cholesterol/gamma-HCH transport system substrate-binding protein
VILDISRSEKVRLGAFLVISVVMLFSTLAYLIGKKMWEEKIEYYTILAESVDGLNPGAPVKLNGVAVGTVTSLLVNPENIGEVLVYFSVQKGTPVKPGMVANLVGGLSITGLKSIELTGGDNLKPNLVANSQIPAGQSQMKQLTGQAESIALKFEAVLNNINTLTSDNNQVLIQDILVNLNRVSVNLDTVVQESRGVFSTLPADIKKITRSFEQTSEEIRLVTNDLRKAGIGDKIGKSLEQTQKVITQLDRTLASLPLQETTEAFMNAAKSMESTSKRADLTIYRMQDDLNSSIKNLRETMANMNDFSRQIRENPSILLRGEEKEQRKR